MALSEQLMILQPQPKIYKTFHIIEYVPTKQKEKKTRAPARQEEPTTKN